MSKLIFTNLFIDNDWDEEKILDSLYPIRVSSTQKILESYLNFGLYLAAQTDMVLVSEQSDPDFLAYLRSHFQVPNEILEANIKDVFPEELISVGISNRENELLEKLSKDKKNKNQFIHLNAKDYLFNIAEKLKLNFPQTRLINLAEFESAKDFPFVIKFLTSSGGRGVVMFDEKKRDIQNYYLEHLKVNFPNIKLLKQAFVEIRDNFYTFSNSSKGEADVFGFKIIYDENRNSKVHIPEKIIDKERLCVSRQLANELRNSGYYGDFGFDGVEDQQGNSYYAIDLNVRTDKSRIIHEASKKFNIEHLAYEFRRERFYGNSFSGFKELNEDVIKHFNNDEFFLLPVLCSNMFNSSTKKQLMEFSFFFGARNEDHDKVKLQDSIKQLYKNLGIQSLNER